MDSELRQQLLKAAVRDRKFLKEAVHDFGSGDFPEHAERVVAQAALDHYKKYDEPIGPLLRTEAEDILAHEKVGAKARQKVMDLISMIQGTELQLMSVQALIDKVKRLKTAAFYDHALGELLEAQDKGILSTRTLSEIVDRARSELSFGAVVLYDYLTGLESRIERRLADKGARAPRFYIHPLDDLVVGLGRGELGMVMAPPGGGKGLFLVHMDSALAMQGYRVLHITLEDPRELVEDRLDASITELPMANLRYLPNKLRRKFKFMKSRLRAGIKIVDARDGGWTVAKMDRMYEQAARDGFQADAITIDYDEYIECDKKFVGDSRRRQEFSEVYTQLVQWAATRGLIIWTAAQSSKAGVGKKIITEKETAEDFSKIRKVFVAISIGSDPLTPDYRYLNVMKHRKDMSHVGVPIMSDYRRALFYDETATFLLHKKLQRQQERG